MKTVYNHSEEIAHIWAHKRQAEARMPERPLMSGGKGSQCFMRDSTLYSYGTHYVIGKHLPGGYVAINYESSSNTTNKHVQEAWHATSHLKRLKVYSPGNVTPATATTEAKVADLLDLAAKAKADGNRPRYLAQAKTLIDDFNTFSKLLKCKDRIKPLDPAAWDAAKHKEYLAKAAKAAKAAEQRRLANLRKEQQEAIKAWRAGAGGAYQRLPHNLPTMLRVSLVDGRIETSRHAYIPVEDAMRLWPIVLRVMRGDKTYDVGMRLGNYRLTKIRADGSIVVNCHDIAFDEIEGIAKTLGLLSVEEVA